MLVEEVTKKCKNGAASKSTKDKLKIRGNKIGQSNFAPRTENHSSRLQTAFTGNGLPLTLVIV